MTALLVAWLDGARRWVAVGLAVWLSLAVLVAPVLGLAIRRGGRRP